VQARCKTFKALHLHRRKELWSLGILSEGAGCTVTLHASLHAPVTLHV
jgi:hypothetical protein